MIKHALNWIYKGYHLIPLQPGSKRIIGGYGPYLKHIEDEEAAAFWLVERKCNYAILTGAGLVCLDFDDIETYSRWRVQWAGLAMSYTEQTRSGYHVFLMGDSLTGRISDKIEVKGRAGFVVAAPSVVNGYQYTIINKGSIVPAPAAFLLLSEKKGSITSHNKPVSGGDVIARVKAAYSVLELAQSVTTLRPGRAGRWWHGACPLEEHKRSKHKRPFWVDTDKQIFGCYACGVRGDVINLYALLNGVSVQDAIKQMVSNL